MTNLDSILKSRDITLPTKVYLVKAMAFPVVMYGCENWTVKKDEGQRMMLLYNTLSTWLTTLEVEQLQNSFAPAAEESGN